MARSPLLQLADTLDLSFIHRVYRTTVILLVVLTPLVWSIFHLAAALGWLIGALLALGVVVSVEWGVRQYIHAAAGQGSGGKLVGLYFLKVLLIGGLMLGAFLLRRHGLLSFRWLLLGFPLPAAVVLLKFLGMQVRAATAEHPAPARRADAGPPPE
jgi:hypothetical protein